MGQNTRGIYPDQNGLWQIDRSKWGTRFRQRGFKSYDEAERWLIQALGELRETVVHGKRTTYTFDQAAAHYVSMHAEKASIETEIYMLQGVMPYIGKLGLHQVHDATLLPFKNGRLKEGRAHKTVNLALGVVRRILNLAATSWRDGDGNTWLEQAPKITMLPLVGHQREPMPITWGQQRNLMPKLPDHLARMSLFILNSGVRDDVACSLRWDWEIKVPELGISVFEVPRSNVKGRKLVRVVICNSVSQSVVESVRGQHPEYVFVYRRERVKNTAMPPVMPYRRIQTMNNTAWQRARTAAGLGDLHVHDLRHTVGMRLREAGVSEGTRSDILWHTTASMTQHYSVAQIVELHDALEKIKDDTGRRNKSLATLRMEQEDAVRELTYPKATQAKKIA